MAIPKENIEELEKELNRDLQVSYLNLFTCGEVERAKNLKKHSERDPIIDDEAKEAIDKGYIKLFESLELSETTGYKKVLCTIKEFKDFTKTAPKPEIAQELYKRVSDRRQNEAYWEDLDKSLKEILEI